MNNRKLSRSIDYETVTLHNLHGSNTVQQPVRRKTYCGNTTWPVNDIGENNNLKHLDGIELVKEYSNTSDHGSKVQKIAQPNSQRVKVTEEEDANDYIDVYLRKITKTM